jgi:hypothetical protein
MDQGEHRRVNVTRERMAASHIAIADRTGVTQDRGCTGRGNVQDWGYTGLGTGTLQDRGYP